MAEDKQPNPLDIKTNVLAKGLVTDLLENTVPNEMWTYARNATVNSHLGQLQLLQNSPSNYLCAEFPYKPVGFIKLLNNRWAVMSTDELNSEIGIFDEKNCTYTRVVNDPCLGFSKYYPVMGASKELFDCKEAIYWTDKKNPRRYMKLTDVPYKFTLDTDACRTKIFTNALDCAELLVDKHFGLPKIVATLGTGGQLQNGTYEFGIAYTINNERITDYYAISNPQSIWSHQNLGQSVDVVIGGLDEQFDQYELIVIYMQNQVVRYKSIGFYPIGVSQHSVADVNRPEYTELSLLDILVVRPKYPYADAVTANDQYLLWYGVSTTPELNYQAQAMKITAQYVIHKEPADYYAKGGSLVGYCRDEVYAFGIQWFLPTGDWSSVFHISGRVSNGKDLGLASGANVYEVDLNPKAVVYQWQATNTAGNLIPSTNPDTPDIQGTGTMAYVESTEQYPSNKLMFDKDACGPIRHHKFPDNTKTHIYDAGGGTINILGIQFSHIEHPKDATGNYIPGITAYRIVRGDRRGNKTVVAKGLMSHVRSYKETDGTQVLYPNYPYNDLRPDTFLSTRQTSNNFGEQGYTALTDYSNTQFNFYSPHTTFSHAGLGTELALYTEEIATVTGFFEYVYQHPRAKQLTQFDLYFALILGALDGYYAASGTRGKTISVYNTSASIQIGPEALTVESISGGNVSATGNTYLSQFNKATSATNDALNFVTGSSTLSLNFAEKVLRALAEVGVFAYFALQTAQKVIDIILEASPWQPYATQYNSHGFFNTFATVETDDRRRYIPFYQYLFDGVNTVEDVRFNNYKREDSVYLRIAKSVQDPVNKDNSRNSIVEAGLCDNPFKKFTKSATMFYGAIKRPYTNQYGALDGVRYQDTGFVDTELTNVGAIGSQDKFYQSGVVYGGDTFINRMTVKRSHQYFSAFVKNVPDGYIIDYRQLRNVAFPRYWMDSSSVDMSAVVTSSPTQSDAPANHHNFNCEGNTGLSSVTVVKNQFFYLFNNGVIDFFCESDYNLDYRDWTTDLPTFYSRFNSDLHTMFRSDRIDLREEYKYDHSYSKQLTENYMTQQRIDYDPTVDATCFQYLKNRVVYSLPAFKDQRGDNWLVYLAANFYDFPMVDFGKLTAIHPIDNQQLIFLFDKASPYVSIGRDELRTDGSGVAITIGDAGLFARPPRPITFSDYHYGNCQSRWAFVNTQMGSYYPSQRQGNLFKYFPLMYRNPLSEITVGMMDYWFNQYLPSYLENQFPNYLHLDNPALGTAIVTGYDPTDNMYYVSKRDYRLKDAYVGKVTYDPIRDKFLINDHPGPTLDNTDYFEDASWTISYSTKDGAFISWHDWKPDWFLQSEKHFVTIKDVSAWKHNDNYTSFCNYYGQDYPFEVEYVVNNGQNVEILKSIEYQLDIGKYYADGRNFHSILDDNFDYMIVYNTEQCSGLLHLVLQSKKDMSALLGYPQYNVSLEAIDVQYAKEEQKHRINQFVDIVTDRGEFTKNNYPIWLTDPNGYIRSLNPVSINYSKTLQLRKKFRSTWHKIFFSKTVSGERKYIMKFANSKENHSPR